MDSSINKKLKKKVLVLIDSNAVIHRAFHALPPLTRKDGTPSGAVYGYALTLLSVIDQLKPDYIAATFDLEGPTFRHKQFKQYKATRVKAPDELYEQIPLVKEMLQSYGVPIYEKKGFEADDILGTLTKDPALEKKVDSVIVTGDLDTLQLVDDDTSVFTLRRGIKDTVLYDTKEVVRKIGLRPEQVVDYKALRGDPSDNIPGVKGIGEKTAVNLLKKYKTLDKVLENIEKVEPKAVREKLQREKKQALLSRKLAMIKTDVEVDFDLESCGKENFILGGLAEIFRKMEFYSLFKRVSSSGSNGPRDQKKKSEKKIELREVKSEKELVEILEKAKKQQMLSFASSKENDGFSAGLSVDGDTGYIVKKKLAAKLLEIFSQSVLKIGFDIKAEQKKYFAQRQEYFENFFDLQISTYLLNAGTDVSLEKCIFEEFGAELEHAPQKQGQTSLLEDISDQQQKAAAERAAWQRRLYDIHSQKLDQISKVQAKEGVSTINDLFENVELALVPILAEMESNGVKVDKKILQKVSDAASSKIGKLERKIYKEAGEEFNINSPSQLAPILYEKLEIPTDEIRKGKTGYSTDADQLRKIRHLHSIVPLIEEYREMFKIKTTYADALPLLVGADGKIHSHFNQAITATGRLSSSDPNLQNIPKRGELADMIRSAFVAQQGHILVSADYSQIDLRVAAHLSGDKKMCEAFKEGKDIHSATAAWVNNVDEDKIDKKKRNEAKSLNFGILYGMGIYGFMRDSGVSNKRAKEFIENYKKTFKGLNNFIEKTKENARQTGYVETQLGRRRYIPNIRSGNSFLRSAAERIAVNLPIQGLAADIMKLAMIETMDLLAKYNKKGKNVSMILQIHDELVFEVKKGIENKFAQELKKAMEKVYKLSVPLTVETSIGSSWKEL